MAKEKFASTLIASTLIDAATVAIVTTGFTKCGEYQVPAGEELAIGFGGYGSQADSIGRLYAVMMNGAVPPVLIPGTMRLSVHSPQDRPLRVLGEWRTERATLGATAMEQRIPLPEHPVNLREDQKLVLEMISDAAATLTLANCTINLDVTKYVV